MAKIRLNIEVSQDLADLIDTLASSEDTTRTEIVRRSLSVLKAFREQQAVGRSHLGFAADPRSLDAEMLGILSTSRREQPALEDKGVQRDGPDRAVTGVVATQKGELRSGSPSIAAE